MAPHSINFETWLSNHPKDHDSKWCRELYPWEVFNRIKYDQASQGLQQHIVVAGYSYYATIIEQRIAENGRLNYLINLRTQSENKRNQWELRKTM